MEDRIVSAIAYGVVGFVLIIVLYHIYQRKRKKSKGMRANLNSSRKTVDNQVDTALPPKTFFEEFKSRLLKSLHDVLVSWLIREIEVLKNFPKTEINFKDFNPKAGLLMFRGEKLIKDKHGAFDQWMDSDLSSYREAVGTISHKIWGNATLLEIWAADHYGKDDVGTAMVLEVFKYCYGKRDTIPTVSFSVLPFLNEVPGRTMEVASVNTELLSSEPAPKEKASTGIGEVVASVAKSKHDKLMDKANTRSGRKEIKQRLDSAAKKSAKKEAKPKKATKVKAAKPAKVTKPAKKAAKPVAKKAAKKAAPKKAAKRRK